MNNHTKPDANPVNTAENQNWMNKTLGLLLLSCLSALLLVTACQKLDDLKDLEASDRDAEFAIPLFTADVNLHDILENFDTTTFISVEDDGLLRVNYKGDITARNTSNLFEVVNKFDGVPLPILDTFVALPFEIPNEVDIDFGILKFGSIEWTYRSLHEEDVRVVLHFPNIITPAGDELRDTMNFTYNGNPITLLPVKTDLAGYKIQPENDSIYVRYELFRKDSQQFDTLSNFFIIIRNFEASYVEGYLGNDIYDLERDTIEIDLFENWTRGDIFFSDPKILLTVQNSFGFPVRSRSTIMRVETVDGTKLNLRSVHLDEGIDIDYPSLNEVGQTKETIFAFNKDNSNIDSILGAGPVLVDYDMDAVPNPDQDTSVRGFMTDSSQFRVQVEVELPIYGKTKGFVARDTFAVDFDAYGDAKYVEFKLVAENQMPLQMDLQLFFADASGQVLDSLFQSLEGVVDAAPVDMEGIVTEEAKTVTIIPLEAEKFNNVKAAKQLFMEISFSSYNDGGTPVKIFADQNLNVRMGMKVGLD